MNDSMVFFFFQAEDGIRDGTVTGVQTCALPIFAIGLYYNATAFDEEKVQPPTLNTTQAELVEIARKMQKNDASGRPTRFGFLPALIGTAYESLVTVVRPFGGDVMNADGTRALLNTPAAV